MPIAVRRLERHEKTVLNTAHLEATPAELTKSLGVTPVRAAGLNRALLAIFDDVAESDSD